MVYMEEELEAPNGNKKFASQIHTWVDVDANKTFLSQAIFSMSIEEER
jgi:hypothetical protein